MLTRSGSGVRPEHAERIFNPLFTTQYDGMGMGLAICRAIVEARGGRSWYASNTPRGAMFLFTSRAD